MLEDVICPSCGFRNSGDVTACGSCNFPIQPLPAAAPGSNPARAAEPSGESSSEFGPTGTLRRPRRRAAPLAGQSVWLWLMFGTFAAGLLIWTAIDANRKRNLEEQRPVAGSSAVQQAYADSARAALAEDSTNVEAHLALGNVLYDTGNWEQAIIHYRAVLRRDSTRVPAIVDLGVCYYNLGVPAQAEELFRQALRLDPHQPIALFNLGIVHDRRGETAQAMTYYQDALQHAPSEELKTTITATMQRMIQKAAPAR